MYNLGSGGQKSSHPRDSDVYNKTAKVKSKPLFVLKEYPFFTVQFDTPRCEFYPPLSLHICRMTSTDLCLNISPTSHTDPKERGPPTMTTTPLTFYLPSGLRPRSTTFLFLSPTLI